MSETNSRQKFEEALSLLNDAAKEKREDIQRLLSDKYSHIKDAIMTGKNQATEVFEEVDENVRKNPWAYIGGVAVGALLLGYILGSQRK